MIVPWRYLNWKGKLNMVFGLINLAVSIVLVTAGDWWWLFNFSIAFLCLMANYLSLNQKPRDEGTEGPH